MPFNHNIFMALKTFYKLQKSEVLKDKKAGPFDPALVKGL
jgi:hypothetical protein